MEQFILDIDQNKFLDAKINYDLLKSKHENFLQSNPNLNLIVKTNFVTLLIREGKLNDAEDLINTILSEYNRTDFKVHPFFHALAYRKLAQINIQLNKLNNAESALNKAIALMLPYNNAKVLSGLYYSLGEINLVSDNFIKSQEYFKNAKKYDEILDGIEKNCHTVISNMIEENSKVSILKLKETQNSTFIKITIALISVVLILVILFLKNLSKYNYYKKLEKYVDYNKKLNLEILDKQTTNTNKEIVEDFSSKKTLKTNDISGEKEITAHDINAVNNQIPIQTKTSIMSKALEDELLIRLKKFEKTNKYLSKDISLGLLASYIDTNTKYLSELIKSHYNCNYNAYINNLRINYVILKLRTDPKYMSYKISYLAEISGFSSHSSFATVFKQITGNTPAVYIDFLKKELSNET